MKTGRIFARWILAAGLIAVLTSCGGGGTGGGTTPPPPPALAIATTSLPSVMQGDTYNVSMQATGGSGSYTWSANGYLPDGITISSAGLLSGICTYAGATQNFFIQISVSDSAGRTASKNYTVTATGKLAVTSLTLPDGNIGVYYNQQIVMSGGTPPFVFTIGNGATLPGGFTLGSAGLLSGTTVTPGTYTIGISVQDSAQPAQTTTGSISLKIGNNLVVTSDLYLPIGVQGVPYNAELTALGGTPPYSWTVSSGNLVSGVNLASSGVISGTPSSLDYSAITVTVTDSSQPATSVGKLFYQTFNPPLTVNSGPVKYYDGILNTSYSYPILVSGGIPPYTATVVQGALPEGFSLNAGYMSNMNGTFTVAGVPTVVGNSSFTIKFTDSESPAVSVSQDATLQITTKLTMSSPPTDLGDVIVGQPMSYQFAASGGILPYHWWGNPVQGVNVDNATGLLSGVPEAPFIGSAYVYVSDSSTPPQQVYASPHLHVADVLKLGTSTLPSLRTNSGIVFQLVKLGGTGPFTWAVSSGSLPTGLTLSSDGLLSGTVSTAGTYPFSITLSDIGPPAQTATVNYSINVGAPGRNDSIATATPISNGQYSGSISPAVDPVTGLLAPDIDYYKLTADPGSAIIIETFADRLSPASPMDSVLEIVDAGGVRLQYCSPYGGDNPYVYTQDCMSDDLTDNNSRDSRVFIMFPTGLSGPQTFYVKVLDWRGTARPDFQYQLNVSGVD